MYSWRTPQNTLTFKFYKKLILQKCQLSRSRVTNHVVKFAAMAEEMEAKFDGVLLSIAQQHTGINEVRHFSICL